MKLEINEELASVLRHVVIIGGTVLLIGWFIFQYQKTQRDCIATGLQKSPIQTTSYSEPVWHK